MKKTLVLASISATFLCLAIEASAQGRGLGRGASLIPGPNCCARVHGLTRTQGLVINPTNGSDNTLIDLDGPGAFVSAKIVKQDGDTDLTFVVLEVDGEIVVAESFAALRNTALGTSNSYGEQLAENATTDIDTVTIGFPFPIHYSESLVLRCDVQEDAVDQIVVQLIHGK